MTAARCLGWHTVRVACIWEAAGRASATIQRCSCAGLSSCPVAYLQLRDVRFTSGQQGLQQGERKLKSVEAVPSRVGLSCTKVTGWQAANRKCV